MSIIFGKKSAALIDMDGVLYDSMPGHSLAWKRMMDELGVECSRDEFYLYEGMTGAATIDLLMHRAFGHGVSRERAAELYAVKSRYFKQMGKAPLMPGADRMLDALRRGGLKRVLVTGSGQTSLLDALDQDYPGCFRSDMRITAHDVSHGKPDPEPYLKGTAKAGVDPANALVIENAPLGVRAGKAAGAFTIAVTTGPIPREEFVREGADMIFSSMEEFAGFLERDLEDFHKENPGHDAGKESDIIYCDDLKYSVATWLGSVPHDRTFVLTDANVEKLAGAVAPESADVFVIPPGEESKSLSTLAEIWKWLSDSGASRRSILLNIGGGVVSDLGGFAAATFKRGIRYANVPTSLLAAADAAIGGKTGIDFNGLKNEVGAFAFPARVFLSDAPLKTLPLPEMLSGIGELVKMALITDASLYSDILNGDILGNEELFSRALRNAAGEKQRIVALDPKEKGLRRILNFGHTAGHAFEMLAARRGIAMTHGEAVAHGIDFALFLSQRILSLDSEIRNSYYKNFLCRYYSPLPFIPQDAGELLQSMAHDKKNPAADSIAFVLLEKIASPVAGRTFTPGFLLPVLSSYLDAVERH